MTLVHARANVMLMEMLRRGHARLPAFQILERRGATPLPNLALLAIPILAVAFTAGARPLAAPTAPTGQPTLTDHINRMCYLWDRGDWVAASDELSTITKMFPHVENEIPRLDPRRKAEYLFVFATQVAKLRQEADAVKLLGEGLRLKPDDALAHYCLGMYLQGNDEKLKELNVAIRLKPDFADAYWLRGIYLLEKPDIRGATTDIETAMRLNPRKAYDYSRAFATAPHTKGEMDREISLMREAAHAYPTDPRPHEMLELLFVSKPDRDSALAEAREWVRLNPNDPDAHGSLGLGLMLKGDLDGAIAELQEALRLDPDLPRYHYELATLLRSKAFISAHASKKP